jgi:hypothetical protein
VPIRWPIPADAQHTLPDGQVSTVQAIAVPMQAPAPVHVAEAIMPGVVSQQTCGGLHTAWAQGIAPPGTTGPPSPPLLVAPDELPLPLLPELPPELPLVDPLEPPDPLPPPLPPPSPDSIDVEPPHALATAKPVPMDAITRILTIRMKFTLPLTNVAVAAS